MDRHQTNIRQIFFVLHWYRGLPLDGLMRDTLWHPLPDIQAFFYLQKTQITKKNQFAFSVMFYWPNCIFAFLPGTPHIKSFPNSQLPMGWFCLIYMIFMYENNSSNYRSKILITNAVRRPSSHACYLYCVRTVKHFLP